MSHIDNEDDKYIVFYIANDSVVADAITPKP